MRILKKYLFALILVLFFSNSYSQGIGIGQWRDQLPYNKCINVAEAGDIIYCATPYSLFYYNKDDNSIERLNKINGLSDIDVSSIKYNNDYKTFVIAYSNANIDLIKNNTIINISDIKRKQMLVKKTINNIMFIDNLAYLSCGFGIVVLDIEKEEIHDTYYIGPDGTYIDVLDMTFNDTSFFAATESGIYEASINNPNLANFAAWTKLNSVPLPNAKYSLIQFFSGKVLANYSSAIYNGDTIYVYDGSSWTYFDSTQISNTHSISSLYNQLIITNNGSVDIFDADFNKTIHVYYPGEIVLSPLYAIIDRDGIIWSADRLKGLIKITGEWEGEKILLNGPVSKNVFAMNVSGNDLWAVPGGYKSSWAPTYFNGYIYSFIENNWFSYYDENTPAFDSINDVVCVTINPWNPKNVYAGTWQTGLLEFNNSELVNIYTDENSTLQRWESDPEKILVGGVRFDDNGNLWVANSGANNILSVKTNEGIWKSFNLGSSASGVDISKMIIDSYNQKWILKRKTSDSKYFIYVFSDNNTISNTMDDEVQMMSGEVGEGNIPGNMVFSIAQDLDREVWIGTDEGIAVFYSPENIFSGSNFDAQRILVQQDGYWQYLLETETVTAIAIDGSNKKWIGTDNAGVFLLSDDGTEQIHHFTEENSPLFSNSISSVVINDDGEVFFGTANGIISFKGTATPGGVTYDDVYAYPNPVREGYTGTIAIKGLVKDADVKITDISGTIIYETKAEGGQAVWDGRNFDGRRARTGVYLVFVSNEDGSETIVTKILFIN